jgi:hypothetical protein
VDWSPGDAAILPIGPWFGIRGDRRQAGADPIGNDQRRKHPDGGWATASWGAVRCRLEGGGAVSAAPNTLFDDDVGLRHAQCGELL